MYHYEGTDKVPELEDLVYFKENEKKKIFKVDKVKRRGSVLHLESFRDTSFASLHVLKFVCTKKEKDKIDSF